VDKELDQIHTKLGAIGRTPVAFEAHWDGDTSGWFLVLSAVVDESTNADEPSYTAVDLTTLAHPAGDIRLFRGEVPPWPEAKQADEIGRSLATQFGVPFFFPSPKYPEDSCPHWWQQEEAYPCGVCGIPLLQREPCPWRGVCYNCHLAQSRDKESG
jgi:hypothetical protein